MGVKYILKEITIELTKRKLPNNQAFSAKFSGPSFHRNTSAVDDEGVLKQFYRRRVCVCVCVGGGGGGREGGFTVRI